jgi:hypothetical protein
MLRRRRRARTASPSDPRWPHLISGLHGFALGQPVPVLPTPVLPEVVGEPTAPVPVLPVPGFPVPSILVVVVAFFAVSCSHACMLGSSLE